MIHTLAQIIERSAVQFPEKDAFRCLDNSITYAQLNIKANQLAAYLITSGIIKGERVGIYMNRCLDTTIAVYGILKAGAAYVPMDPFMPLNRTISIMQDCGIEHVMTTPSQLKKIKSLVEKTSFLKSIVGISENLGTTTFSWENIYSKSLEDFCPPRIMEEDLAFILYTSGSTGIPKGIMHTHKSGLSLARLAANLYDFNETDRIGTFAPLHFDPSTFGYYASPLVGATAVIIPDAHLKLPVSLSALVEKEKITVWFSVPLVLIQLLTKGEIEKHDFSSLRWVLFAGEVFITKHLRALMQQWPHAQFSNLYGPAEVILCTYYNLDSVPEMDEPIPIGTVWGNTEYKILDHTDKEAKKGVPGELVVRTTTMMHGYWDNKALTEQSFYRVKIASGYDHIYYRTGDLVKENDNNELLFLGRNDRQIKLRGYRIELDEIEFTLLKHELIEEAAVMVVEKSDKSHELVAVVKPLFGSSIEAQSLTAFCKTYLPGYAVPETVEILEDFPRTSSGKINRKEITKMLLPD